MKAEKPAEKTKAEKTGILIIIRIAGQVEIKKDVVETLYRLKLRKKYSASLIHPSNKGLMGMLNKVQHYVAYGEIDKETLVELMKARLQSTENKKFNAEEIAENAINGKNLNEMGFKGFFRLHPPRKGINSKQIYPKGVLGNHGKKINELVRRML
jgi:large subunit ribosomal protein L30